MNRIKNVFSSGAVCRIAGYCRVHRSGAHRGHFMSIHWPFGLEQIVGFRSITAGVRMMEYRICRSTDIVYGTLQIWNESILHACQWCGSEVCQEWRGIHSDGDSRISSRNTRRGGAAGEVCRGGHAVEAGRLPGALSLTVVEHLRRRTAAVALGALQVRGGGGPPAGRSPGPGRGSRRGLSGNGGHWTPVFESLITWLTVGTATWWAGRRYYHLE